MSLVGGDGLDSRRGVPLGVRIRTPGSYGLLLLLIVALLTATAVVGRSAAGRAIVVILQGGVLLFARGPLRRVAAFCVSRW